MLAGEEAGRGSRESRHYFGNLSLRLKLLLNEVLKKCHNALLRELTGDSNEETRARCYFEEAPKRETPRVKNMATELRTLLTERGREGHLERAEGSKEKGLEETVQGNH